MRLLTLRRITAPRLFSWQPITITPRSRAFGFWVAHEAQLDLVDNQGANALHAAAFNDRPEVCAILIAAGLDPAAQMPNGWTALSHYGLFLDDNDPDARGAVPPAGEEGPELGASRGPLMHALIGSSLRLTAAKRRTLRVLVAVMPRQTKSIHADRARAGGPLARHFRQRGLCADNHDVRLAGCALWDNRIKLYRSNNIIKENY